MLRFKYWRDEPGADAMCYWTENHQILFFACAALAGQLYPDEPSRIPASRDVASRQGPADGARVVSGRGAGGFVEWDSNVYFEEDLLALSHLWTSATTPKCASWPKW